MYHHVAVGVPEGRCPSPYCGIMDSFADFLRVNVQPQQLFSRLTTVLVSAKDGVYALVGKLRQGSKETVTCELMFDAEKGWTQEKAEAWAKEHKNSVDVSNTEETEDFVHVRVRDPDLFVDGSFRSIDIDAERGVKAVVGKLKSDPKGAMVVQKFVFAKEKNWTMEKAEAWIKEHKDSALPAEGGGQPKTDRERFMAHFGVTAEAFQKFYDLLGDELFKLLPDRGQKIRLLGDRGNAAEEAQGELEKKREEAARRCARTPIKFNEGKGHLTKPEEYQNVPDDDFADPCNYAYPMVPEDRLRAAWQRLHQEENRAAGGYTSEEWEWMKNRVEKRLKEKGAEVKADSLDPFEVLEKSRRVLNLR